MLETALAIAGTATGVALVNKIGDAMGWWVAPHQLVRMAKKEAIAARIRAESDIEVADLMRRAALRAATEEIAHQYNMESIVLKALQHLQDDATPGHMEADWIVNFFDKARIVSDDAMQERWAKLLAGQANRPGSFSRRAVNLLADMDTVHARMFETFCSFLVQIGNGLVPCILLNEEGNLHEFYEDNGMDINVLVELSDIGLITLGFAASVTLSVTHCLISVPESVTVAYGDKTAKLQCPTGRVTIGIATLPPTGRQLAQLCLPTTPFNGFFELVCERWESMCSSRPMLTRGIGSLAY